MEIFVLGFTTPDGITELYRVIELAMLRRYYHGAGDIELLLGLLRNGTLELAKPHSLSLKPIALHWRSYPCRFCVHSRAIINGQIELHQVHLTNARPAIIPVEASESCLDFASR